MEDEDFYEKLRKFIFDDIQSSPVQQLHAGVDSAPLVTYSGGYGGYDIKLSRGWQLPPLDRHEGFDVLVPSGTPIQLLKPGKVLVRTDEPKGYGWYLVIQIDGTNDGIVLAHLSAINVRVGDQIASNTIVGATGGIKGAQGAGNSGGAHLHYEYRIGVQNKPWITGVAVNPVIVPPSKPINTLIKLLKP
ncbi:MAG: M23 family metallopeptidase [Sediminibacterium sp.]